MREHLALARLAFTAIATLVTSGILIKREFWRFMRIWWLTEK